MQLSVDLTPDRCRALLAAGSGRSVGSVAYATPAGPGIVPVSYAVVDDAVVFRVAPFSELASHLWGAWLAFTVDDLDPVTRTGWSVVVRGRAEVVDDLESLQRIHAVWRPRPWGGGQRAQVVRLPWTELTGRCGAHPDRPPARHAG